MFSSSSFSHSSLKMENWGLFLLLLLASALPSLGSSKPPEYLFTNELRIDCGATSETAITDDGLIIKWFPDELFTKSGQNSLLVTSQNFSAMNTLRFFSSGHKNCYKLPFYFSERRYIFRAGFYYGNYDGLNRPPSFNLVLDDTLWATVKTSTNEDEPVYHEVIYWTKKNSANVCLVRTSDEEVPFISSLEAIAIYDESYVKMENRTALYLQSRINYGANESIQKLIGSFEERYNRIWKSNQLPEYLNISMAIIPEGNLIGENNPPWPVMGTAIQAKNVTDSIHLFVDFSTQTEQVAYFVLYFMDPIWRFPPNQTGKVEIYIDSKKLNVTDVPSQGVRTSYSVVTLYPVQVFGVANVTISPANGSTLAPLLNAMEVFSVIQVSQAELKFINPSLGLSFIFLHFLIGVL